MKLVHFKVSKLVRDDQTRCSDAESAITSRCMSINAQSDCVGAFMSRRQLPTVSLQSGMQALSRCGSGTQCCSQGLVVRGQGLANWSLRIVEDKD